MNTLQTPTSQPLVSVVVTTRNEEKNIGNCLHSIRAQTWSAIEAIVVDNHSTDATLEISARLADKVATKGPERSVQRNHGMIDLASGEYVMYIDADMVLSPRLVECCVEHIQRTGAAALHVSETVLGTRYFSRVRRFERSFYDGTPIDGARFFHRPTFTQIGGFDEALFVKGSGEDWDIDKKIKQVGKIAALPAAAARPFQENWEFASFVAERGVPFKPDYVGIYHNEAEFELVPYLRKKSYYAQGFDGYIEKWGRDDPDIRSQFGLGYRYWTVFTEKGKWLRLLRRPDLAFGMYFLRVLVGIVFVLNKLGIQRRALSK
jgi:glycosyltransferase involved in cell wall biosynthesis